jgi:hypothetical protein
MGEGTSMLSVTIGSGRDADSPVTHTAWVIPRHIAEDLLRGFREELGPPRVESIGTVGGTVESYERSQREGTALFWPEGDGS